MNRIIFSNLFVVLCVSLFGTLSLFGQDEEYDVRIRHYERKVKLNYLPLPSTTFNPADFNIVFPDTMYSQSQVEVKKFKLEVSNGKIFKNAYIIITSKEKNIKQVNIAIHLKYQESFENYLNEHYNLNDAGSTMKINIDNTVLDIEREVLKRQINYKFTFESD